MIPLARATRLLLLVFAACSAVAVPLAAATPDFLSPEEQQFLQQRNPLRYAPDPAFPPFEFFRADGHVAGITPEILELLADELHVKIEAVRYPTWDAVLDGVRRGEVDLLGTLTRTADRETFLAFTEPYLSVPNVLYVAADSRWQTRFAELAGRRIAVVRSAGAHAWLMRNHPEVAVVPVANTAEGFRLVSLGEVDAMLETLPVGAFVISEQGFTNLRPLPEIVFTVPQHLAVRRGDERLRAILEKGLARLSPEQRLRIFSRWTGEDPAQPRWRIPAPVWRGVAGLSALLLGFVAWNYLLRRQVTHRTRELQASEQQFRRVLEDLPIAAAWTDESGRVEFVNRKFTALFGYTLADIPTIDDWFRRAYPEEAMRRDIVQRWRAEVARLAAEGSQSASGTELAITCADGSTRRVHIVTSVIGGKILGIFEDHTERDRIEQKLRQAQKMEAIGQLAGGVAHDFNNLLTVVLGQAQVLLLDPALPPDQRSSLQQIADVARRGAGLTRQLLTFSRQQAMQPVSLDVNGTLRAMHQLLARLLGEQITIQLDCAPALPAVRADPSMIEQILLNLSVNARDAMPKSGTLTLATRVTDVEPTSLPRRPAGARAGHFVVITVRDTGSGIAPAHLARLFEPFFTTKEVGHGTGLGLATVYGIVQQHQGWIEVASTVGHGTAFDVYLPIATAPGETPSHTASIAAAPAAAPRTHATVLLAEDETPVRELVCICLEREGHRVLAASSGDEALALWQQHHAEIDLLFTDIVMPGSLDGRELAARLRQDKPTLRVVYATGYGRHLLPPGETRSPCLAKPFDLATLQATVRQALANGA